MRAAHICLHSSTVPPVRGPPTQLPASYTTFSASALLPAETTTQSALAINRELRFPARHTVGCGTLLGDDLKCAHAVEARSDDQRHPWSLRLTAIYLAQSQG